MQLMSRLITDSASFIHRCTTFLRLVLENLFITML